MEKVNVIGAGLAGVEAVHQLIKQGIPVRLYEMRPVKMTDAHESEYFAELVCSNSLRADGLGNAVGVLKEEMRMNESIIMKFAEEHRVPAGGSLAVDRIGFSKAVTEYISTHPLVEVIHEEVHSIPSMESLPPPEVQRIYRIAPEQYGKSVHIPSPKPALPLPGISAPILQAAPGSSPEPDIHKLRV